jgi:hypothetical protein
LPGEIEVACNLLDTDVSSPVHVIKRLRELAAGEGVELGEPYLLSKSPEQLVAEARQQLGERS